MTEITFEKIKAFVVSMHEEKLVAAGFSPDKLPDDFDLLGEAIIDSLGVMQMINSVESEFEIEVDFEDLDVEQLTVVGTFSRFVADNAESHVADSVSE